MAVGLLPIDLMIRLWALPAGAGAIDRRAASDVELNRLQLEIANAQTGAQLGCMHVVFHILGGCCWHHAHADCASCCEDEQRPAGTNGRANGSSTCEIHHSEDDCDEGDCAFIAAGSRSVVKAVGGLVASAVVYTHTFVAASTTTPHSARESPSPSSSPPLRLHLVNQVLLI